MWPATRPVVLAEARPSDSEGTSHDEESYVAPLWKYHTSAMRWASLVLILGFAAVVCLVIFALFQTQSDCTGLLCNPVQITTVVHESKKTREWSQMTKGIRVSRMIISQIFNNTSPLPDITQGPAAVFSAARQVQTPLYNNPYTNITIEHRECKGWQEYSCTTTTLQLVPCYTPEVKARYLADSNQCSTPTCQAELQLMFSLPHTMCLNQELVLTDYKSRLRINVVKNPQLTDESQLELLELLVALPSDNPFELSDDTRSLRESVMTWRTYPVALLKEYGLNTQIRLKEQRVRLFQFPYFWRPAQEALLVESEAKPSITLHNRKVVSLDQSMQCSPHLSQGSCMFMMDILQDEASLEVLIQHKSLLAMVAQIGGLLSVVSLIGKVLIRRINGRSYEKLFVRTYGENWAHEQLEPREPNNECDRMSLHNRAQCHNYQQ